MTAAPRVIQVLAWQPPVPGRDRPAAPAWQDGALCAETDPALFYPGDGQPAAPALRVCAACPVRAACLQHALDAGELWGVWGGTTERERQAVIARRDAGRNGLAA
jgi:WhiB family transcriptional regulator, redox-sensing transcriptional regulator